MSPSTNRIGLRVPIIVLVLAATAIPIELRLPSQAKFDFGIDPPSHFLVNVAGYLPAGIVLGELGLLRAVAAAAAISVFAETSQLAMLYRDPSLSDIVANVLGALLGAAVARRWRISRLEFRINRWIGLAAAAAACGTVFWMWAGSGGPVNSRGWASPGILEARWQLDDAQGREVRDSSGSNLHAAFSSEPLHAQGVNGTAAAVFDGRSRYVAVGPATALRLAGSMTITAWINSTSFPGDDAAIVSQFDHDLGYQLDTTVDRGPRTIGFKLTNACGDLMMRYGRTPLLLDTWYHVAGVYNAEAKTLDVYLNGRQDDGDLTGLVTGTQRPSRAAVHIGRRADRKSFDFAGLMEDVRIYSLALTKTEIEAVMHGGAADRAAGGGADGSHGTRRPKDVHTACAAFAEPYDIELPLAAAAVGALAAIACIGIQPRGPSALFFGVSGVGGLLLLGATWADLPLCGWISIPLSSLIGGASIIHSRRRSKTC